MAKAKKENELRLVRVFEAPVTLVWEAWVNEDHVKNWWGPRGFSITTKSKDVSPGGQWIYTMHGPDKVDYPNITTYFEVEKYKRLVYDHGASEGNPPLFRVTVTFEEFKGKTVMDMTMALATPEAAKEIGTFIKQVNGDATWDRLAEYLENYQTQKDIFVINRTFKTDQKTLFEMWTNPEHLASWMGPAGSNCQFINIDVREGGGHFYSMTYDHGLTMYGKVTYKKIQPNDLLIYSQNFANEQGQLCKPSFAPTFPDKMLTTIEFYSEDGNETRLKLKWEIDGSATEEEKATFHMAKDGMTPGWSGSFDRLDEVLKD